MKFNTKRASFSTFAFTVMRNDIRQEIKKLNLPLVMLFGSYAKNTSNSKSDIDIYINTTNKQIKKQVELIDSKISVKMGDFDKENLLIKEIIKNQR